MVTALRETREESGLLETDLKIYPDSKHVLDYEVGGKPKKVIYWLAQLIHPNAKVQLSDEHQDYKWLQLEEACSYGKFEDMQNMLRKFEEYIKQNVTGRN